MAIEWDKAISVKEGMNGYAAVKRTIDYIEDDHHHIYDEKAVIDYAENPDKTTLRVEFIQENEDRLKADYAKKNILISSIANGEISRRLDAVDFMGEKKRYEKYKAGDRRGMGLVDKGSANNRDAYHVIQSFNESCKDLDPRLVHQMGVEYAKEAFPGYKCIVTTHQNTEHAHNHILVCAYNEDGQHKLHLDSSFRRNIRKINDEICHRYGLHTLDPELIFNRRNTRYIERKIRERGKKTMKDQVREDIVRVLGTHGKSFTCWQDFVDHMENHMNYKIEQTEKRVTYIKKDLFMKNGKPFKVRDDKLGNCDIAGVYYDHDFFLRRYICEHFGWDKWRSVDKETGKILEEKQEYASERQKRIQEKKDQTRSYNDSKIFDEKGNLAFTRSFTPHHEEKFFISRWTESGRRRSDLELIVLAVIYIIKKIRDFFKKPVIEDDRRIFLADREILEKDIRNLSKCLDYINKYDIKEKTDLENLHETLGSALSDLTADREFYGKKIEREQENKDTLNDLRNLAKEAVKLVGSDITADILRVYEPNGRELEAFRSEHEQGTGKVISGNQKRKLYQLLNLPGQKYQLKCAYDDLNFNTANAVIRFLSGKTDKKPDVLASPEEAKADRREKLYRKIFDKIEASKHSDKLTLGQGLGLKEHFRDIPLTDDKTIRKDQIDALNRRLAEKGLAVNRPVEYITKSEYRELKAYLDTGKGKEPELLKEFKPMSYSTKSQVTDLLEMTGKSLVIPVEYISEAQGKILVSNLLYHYFRPEAIPEDRDLTPDEIRMRNRDLEQEFITVIQSYPKESQDIIVKLRNLQTKLYEAGFDINSGFELQSRITHDKNILESLDLKIAEIDADFNNVDNLYRVIDKVEQIFYKQDLSQFLNIEDLLHKKEQELEQVKESIVDTEFMEPKARTVDNIAHTDKEDIIYPTVQGRTYELTVLSNLYYEDTPLEEQTAIKNILYNMGAFDITDINRFREFVNENMNISLNMHLFSVSGRYKLKDGYTIDELFNEVIKPGELAMIQENMFTVRVVGKNPDGSITDIPLEEFFNADESKYINAFNEQKRDTLTTTNALVKRYTVAESDIESENKHEKKLSGWDLYNKKYGIGHDL